MNNAIKSTLVFIAILLSLSFTCEQDKHVGRWKSIERKEPGYFVLDAEGYATIEEEGETIGGKSFVVEGKTFQLKYEINYKKKPITIDFIKIEMESGKELHRMLGIIEFINDDRIRVAFDPFKDERPSDFVHAGSMEFERVE